MVPLWIFLSAEVDLVSEVTSDESELEAAEAGESYRYLFKTVPS